MGVNIRSAITSNWPTTESVLIQAGEEVGYAAQKHAAIERAKSDLYGDSEVPVESQIPTLAAYWIADKACLYLIPLARDYVGIKFRRDEKSGEASVSYYDLLSQLDSLEATLQKRVDDALEAAQAAIRVRSRRAGDTPVVSVSGLLVDPDYNARRR
jgi:hypothetical protein